MNSCLTQTSHLGSAKFGFISSEKLVSSLESSGLSLDKVVEMSIRKNKEMRQGFQKHRMVFNTGMKSNDNDGNLQLLVTNSHEGSTSLKFQLGFFRYICANGLIVGKNVALPMSVRHTVDNALKINETIEMVLDQKNRVFESIEELKAKKWNQDQLKKFTQGAMEIRGYDLEKKGILTPDFRTKRNEDNKGDAFTLFNVVQENILRTGFKARTDKNEVVTMRAIRSLEEQNRINVSLWDLALGA
jgi:hypothetical protein